MSDYTHFLGQTGWYKVNPGCPQHHRKVKIVGTAGKCLYAAPEGSRSLGEASVINGWHFEPDAGEVTNRVGLLISFNSDQDPLRGRYPRSLACHAYYHALANSHQDPRTADKLLCELLAAAQDGQEGWKKPYVDYILAHAPDPQRYELVVTLTAANQSMIAGGVPWDEYVAKSNESLTSSH